MCEDKQNESVSLFSQSAEFMEDDALEEIFALNLGDFLTETLISEDLAKKISEKETDKTEGLKKQSALLYDLHREMTKVLRNKRLR